MALCLWTFQKQYSKTSPSHTSTFSRVYTCFLLDASTGCQVLGASTCNTDVFRVEEAGTGISGGYFFQLSSNSDLPCPGKVNTTATVSPSVREEIKLTSE